MAQYVAVDQFRRKSMFGVEATYRVAAVDRAHALMQVVDVPGLPAGMEIRMDLAAVGSMTPVNMRAEVGRALEGLLQAPRVSARAA